jgi:hypothetical protein
MDLTEKARLLAERPLDEAGAKAAAEPINARMEAAAIFMVAVDDAK